MFSRSSFEMWCFVLHKDFCNMKGNFPMKLYHMIIHHVDSKVSNFYFMIVEIGRSSIIFFMVQYWCYSILTNNNENRINYPIGQSIDWSINRSIDQSISQSINQLANQSINQSIKVDQSFDQSINQSINQLQSCGTKLRDRSRYELTADVQLMTKNQPGVQVEIYARSIHDKR